MQAKFSSFIRPKRKTRSSKSPRPLHLFDSPDSPHPYASPEVFDITDYNGDAFSRRPSIPPLPSHSTEDMDSQIDGLPYSPGFQRGPGAQPDTSPTTRREESPQVKLDINISPEPLSDLFPAHFLNSDIKRHGSSEDVSHTGVKVQDEQSNTYGGDQDDDESYTSEDIMVAKLEAMDASSFVSSPGKEIGKPVNISVRVQPSAFAQSRTSRKIAPTPIKIPNIALHGPKVQLVRSSTASQTPQSRPISPGSLEDASAVSGTTLARALLANTFVLSSDRRASRYRSGGSVLTRSDSAVLPKGDNPFLLSATSDTFSPEASIPPVPPVPKNAELVYIPPANTRDRSDHTETSNRASDDSMFSPGVLDIIVSPSSLMRSDTDSNTDATEARMQDIARVPEPLSVLSEDSENSRVSLDSVDVPKTAELLSPTSINRLSAAPSSAGREEINNVLDSYRVSDPPLGDNSYRPAFSPISEESSSQLSPPSPFVSRHGRAVLSTTSSSSSATGRIEWSPTPSRSHSGSLSRRDGLQVSNTHLLPIGERPRSFQPVPISPTSTSSPGYPTIASLSSPNVSAGPLDFTPPPVSSIFNRQRSGSAPSPIRVVRDSKDYNSYNITVTPGPSTASDHTPSTGNSDYGKQTFPETPSAFSPIWTPGSSHEPEGALQHENDVSAGVFPTMSAVISGTVNGMMPNIAQQVLLTRAATSVRGARHSRQGSVTRARTIAQRTYDSSASPQGEPASETQHPGVIEEDCEEPLQLPPEERPLSWESPTEFSTSRYSHRSEESSPSLYGTTGPEPDREHRLSLLTDVVPPPPPLPPFNLSEHVASIPSSSNTSNNSSHVSLGLKELPSLPPSSSSSSTSIQSSETPVNFSPPSPALAAAAPTEYVATVGPITVPSVIEPEPLIPAPPPPPPPSQSLVSQPAQSFAGLVGSGLASPFDPSFGSPPPYDTIVYESGLAEAATPSTGGSGLDRGFQLPGNASPTPSAYSRDGDQRATTRDSASSMSRRGRMRPPLPAGPRRPSQQGSSLRQRNPSISSTASGGPSRSRTFSATLPSPRFQTPPLKWRGYPMDAAKWTFTSSQLQTIVSRAIRQSAEASSIRLLRLETLDHDIPEETHRLEMQRTDVKARYKMLTRRRAELLASLTSHLGAESDSIGALRLVEDLKDVSTSLDRLAEDLHSADEQLAQLNSLRDVHSASALAMALRKLNASFLKEYADNQALREKVDTLQAERDEARKQAEEVAYDYDHLQEKVQDPSPDTRNKRSSRVLASRKSSVRVSKAGLRSARSSMSSTHRISVTTLPSGARSTFSIEDVPPVPPIPRSRPNDIVTDFPARSSGLSTDGITPTSETRAMIRAHEELCEMLGIASGNDIRFRRSRSASGSRAQDSEGLASRANSRPGSAATGRPTSLPGASGLTEVYHVMTADRHAILATLGILSD